MEWSGQHRKTPAGSLTLAVVTGLALTGAGWATGLLDFGRPDPPGLRMDSVLEPAPAAIEDCNRHAALPKRDAGRVIGDAVVGNAIGGTAENARTESARAAYGECMARRGYAG